MGFWTDLGASINEATQGLQNQMAQFKNAKFADAAMAMCALVAKGSEGGSVDAVERQKTFKLIQKNKLLEVFDMKDLKVKFDAHCAELEDDFDFGKMECLAAIAKVKGKAGQDRAVIQIGVIIGGSDLDFDDDEKQMCREGCHAVGIDPGTFDL